MYGVFTNEQLAEMVRQRAGTKAALKGIEGVGEARVEKYGAAVLERRLAAGFGRSKTSDERHETERQRKWSGARLKPVSSQAHPGQRVHARGVGQNQVWSQSARPNLAESRREPGQKTLAPPM